MISSRLHFNSFSDAIGMDAFDKKATNLKMIADLDLLECWVAFVEISLWILRVLEIFEAFFKKETHFSSSNIKLSARILKTFKSLNVMLQLCAGFEVNFIFVVTN